MNRFSTLTVTAKGIKLDSKNETMISMVSNLITETIGKDAHKSLPKVPITTAKHSA